MIGIYFSGTGNTKYCIEKFLELYNNNKEKQLYSIENKEAINKIKENKDITFAYPIYYSDMPIIVKDFVNKNKEIFKNKNVFIIVTMGLFSGDGAGCLARILRKYKANILGGLHLKMPDCIGDVKLLKKSLEENKIIVKSTELKIKKTVSNIKNGKYSKEGLHFYNHVAGLLGQRLWYYNKTSSLKDKLKINYNECIGCSKCSINCPIHNIKMLDNKPKPLGSCTSCYRCINNCPKQAITLIGKEVYEQSLIEKYLD